MKRKAVKKAKPKKSKYTEKLQVNATFGQLMHLVATAPKKKK